MITPYDVDELHKQTREYHHPHYRGATKNEHNRVIYAFAPFNGDEPEPTHPDGLWSAINRNDRERHARDFVAAMYDQARERWRDARYARDLRDAAQGAPELWDAYTRARTAMDEAYTALRDTTDGEWRAAVSRLLDTQKATREAASTWDAKAARIAEVHDRFLYSPLSQQEAYAAAGLDAADWVVDSACAYQSPWGTTPLLTTVRDVIEEQQDHVRTVSELTGDRTAL